MTESFIENIRTYTHVSHDGTETFETLLIGVNIEYIGMNNTLEPPNSKVKSLTRWLRSQYTIQSNKIFAQVPRNIYNYPPELTEHLNCDKIFTEEVFTNNDCDEIRIRYEDDFESIHLIWDLKNDKWTVKSLRKETEENNVESGEWNSHNIFN